MGDPLKELHRQMYSSGYLNDDKKDYKNFVLALQSDDSRKALYDVLKQNGKVSASYDQFSGAMFADYDNALAQAQASESIEKKKDGGSDSFIGKGSAQTADAGTNQDDYSDLTSGMEISDADLINKIKNKQDSQVDIAGMPRESTGVNMPMRSLPQMDIKADMDPKKMGSALLQQREEDFDFKERSAGRSEFRTAARDIKKIELFNEKADEQARMANFHMQEAYGKDWLEQMAALKEQTSPEYLARSQGEDSPNEIIEKQARLNNMVNDPMFTKFTDAVSAQQSAYKQYKEAAKKPEYAKYIADREASQQAADKSALFKGMSFLGQVTGPVIAGIANLPRTVASAVGIKDAPIIDDLSDWADEQTRFIESGTSLGSKNPGKLWRVMTQYKGMDVEVDNTGRPISAYKDGKPVDMSDDDVRSFIEDKAGENARDSFVGWENAGFSTAKTLANLYLMRNLGGGTAIGTGATSFITTYNDLYNEALNDLGYDAAAAAQYAIANAGVQAAAEATFGKIDVAPMRLQAARSFGMREAKAIAGKVSAMDVGKAAGKAIAKEVLGENVEELVQMASDNLTTALFNAKTGGNIQRDTDAMDVAETILLTTATTLIGAGADSGRIGRSDVYNSSLVAAAQNPNAIAPVLEQMVASGHLLADQVQVVTERLQHLARVNQSLPADMSVEDRGNVLALELQKKVVAPSATGQPAEVKTEKQQAAAIDAKVDEIINPQPAQEGAQATQTTEQPETTEVANAGPEVEIPASSTEQDGTPPVATTSQPEQIANIEPTPETVEIKPASVEPNVQEKTYDYSAFLSDKAKAIVTPADNENLAQWVEENLADEQEVAQYPSKDAAIKAFVSEYENYMLAPRMKGRKQSKEEKAAAANKAAEIADKLDDNQADTVDNLIDRHTMADGTVDVDGIKNEVETQNVSIPEGVKQIIYGESETVLPVGAQPNEYTAQNPETPAVGGIQEPGRGAAQAVGERVNETPTGPQAPAEPSAEVDRKLQEAPLPALNSDVLDEMLDDGLISMEQHEGASAYLYADDKSDAAIEAHRQSNAAREGLRTVKQRTNLHDSGGVTVDRREDGVVEIRGHVDPQVMKQIGAKYNGINKKFEVPADKEVEALEAISASLVDRQKVSSVEAETNKAVNSPEFQAAASRRNQKFKAATNFGERLGIARAEHGMREEAKNGRKFQAVLNKLKASFPGVKINTGATEFNAKFDEFAKAKGLEVDVRNGIHGVIIDGRWHAPMGFVLDGQVYINPDLAHPDTLVHEIGHIWTAWMKQNNVDEFNRGASLVRTSPYMDAVKSNPMYADLDEDGQAEEALANAIGDAGRMMLDMTPFMEFRKWLGDMWRGVGRFFGRQRVDEYTIQNWADSQARTLLSGQTITTMTSEQIARAEQNDKSATQAQYLFNKGYSADQIYAATGARMQADGTWLVTPVGAVAKYDATSTLQQEGNLSDIVDIPAINTAFPDFQMQYELKPEADTPYVEDGRMVMKPTTDKDYLAKVAELAQQALPVEKRTDYRFATTAATNAMSGSVSHAARVVSAKQIIEAEIAQEGMKDYDKKSRSMADALGLRYEDVLRLWENEAHRQQLGHLVISLGDAKSLGGGKFAQLKEAYDIRRDVAKEKIATFLQRYFTVRGLFPAQIKALAEARANRIAGRMVQVKYLLSDLNKAMKEAYGKPDEIHYRLVDNVLRGEADWRMLPEGVREAAIAIRDFTDMLSQQLVTSGATNGKAILTILNNSGVAASAANMTNWRGVNLFEALNKLPYMRTDVEHEAIRTFLQSNSHMLGSYFYRSYRKNTDKDWAKKVPPRVLADARDFIEGEIRAKVQAIDDARLDKVFDLDMENMALDNANSGILQGLINDIDNEKNRLDRIKQDQAIYTHKKGQPNKALEIQQRTAERNIKEWEQTLKEANAVNGLDIEIVMDLTAADLSVFAADIRKIVKNRIKKARNLEKIDLINSAENGVYDNLVRILNTPPGASGGIDGIIYNEILAVDEPSGAMPTAKLGSKDLGFLKARKDIPAPIRELMGEFHDARLNFVQSAMRMINTIEDQQFLVSLRSQFEGQYFWPPEAKDMGVEIGSRGSASMDPLNGWRTTPEIKQALAHYYSPRVKMPIAIQALRYFSDLIKYGKTILSPVTHARNFVSNFYFIAQNGYMPRDAAKSWDAFRVAWDMKTDAEQREYLVKLASIGVLGGGAASSDIRAVISRVNGDAISNLQGGSVFTRAMRTIQNTYTAEDDFFRIMAYEAESRRYAKAIYGKKYDDLNADQQADIDNIAASLVSETMPTYSKVPEAANFIREVPLFGTFIAFPAEMFRVTYNQVKRTRIDLQDPRTRGIGMARLAGMAIAQTAPIALAALFRHIIGVSAEEEKAARFFVPEWQQDSMWMWDEWKPGEMMSFRNLGYSDPYAFYKRPIMRMVAGPRKDIEENMADGAWSLVQPFLDVELTTGTILALAYNRNQRTGENIYNPGAGILQDWRSVRDYAVRQLQPGVVKFGFDIASTITGEGQFGKPPKQWDDIVMNMVGYATEKTEFERAIQGKIREIGRQIDYSRQYFMQNRYKYKNDPAGMASLYERTTDMYNESLKDVSLLIRNAQIVGVPSQTLKPMLKSGRNGFSEKEITAAVSGSRLLPKFKGYNR